ncbi:hypothetical protein L6164_016865 [Bauhinia variegata]|uniref:Uncharacterized protein n=1 Tax=Bauhinia variegata TaxID=167791 RepID=A0ACB9N5Z6_BAUVA|nr:hypothetical protein L6164_016865 [Bauhinia variegata]
MSPLYIVMSTKTVSYEHYLVIRSEHGMRFCSLRYIDPIPKEEGNHVQPSQTSLVGLEVEDNLDEQYYSEFEFEGEKERSVKSSNWRQFNEAERFKDVSFELGMEFINLDVFKQAVKDYSVSRRMKLKFFKNDSKRCRAKCEDPCPWVIMCSWCEDMYSFQVKTYYNEHTCSRTMFTKKARCKWLTMKLLPFLRSNAKPREKMWTMIVLDGSFWKGYYGDNCCLQLGKMGLVPSISEILPNRKYRFCFYHIYHNYAKNFKGKDLKDLLWKCAKWITMREFECNKDILKQTNDKACDYLAKGPSKTVD